MLFGGEAPRPHVLGECAHRRCHLSPQVCVALDEAGLEVLEDPEQVVEHEDLAVRRRPRADADRRNRQAFAHYRRDLGRDRLEHEGEASRRLQCQGVVEQLACRDTRARLSLEAAAERRRRLRGEAEVPHHGDPRAHDRAGTLWRGALELDDICTALLDEAQCGVNRLLGTALIGAKWEVANQQRRVQSAASGLGQHQHLLQCHRRRSRITEHGHRRGVAREHEVDARLLGGPSRGHVVGGDHHDRFPFTLLLGEQS